MIFLLSCNGPLAFIQFTKKKQNQNTLKSNRIQFKSIGINDAGKQNSLYCEVRQMRAIFI